jgi:hypothetical protein
VGKVFHVGTGLLRARLVRGQWQYLTPFKPTLKPKYKLLNCEELIQDFTAEFGPPKRSERVRAIEPRDPKKQSIFLINKKNRLIGRQQVNGELCYEVPWRPMWLSESEIGESPIREFWSDYLQTKGKIQVKRRQNYRDSTRQKRSKHN